MNMHDEWEKFWPPGDWMARAGAVILVLAALASIASFVLIGLLGI